MPTNPPVPGTRGRFDATVESNRLLCREHYLLRLRVGRASDGRTFPPTQPGQFVQLGCRPPNGSIPAEQVLGNELEWQPGARVQPTQVELCAPLAMLRRPFSLAGRGDDDAGTWIEVIHRVVGVGTQWLANLKPGDPVDLIGPLGNAFELTAGKSIGLLVGGGVGLPPMFYLAESLAKAGWTGVGFVGAMSRDLLAVTIEPATPPDAVGTPLPSVREFARHGFGAVITTDDGSMGLRGRITAGLERYLQTQTPDQASRTVVFTCGPEPMMHAVAHLAKRHGVDCQVCLEQAMACGMGTCQSCVVRIEDHERPQARTETGRPWRYRLACTDGPVFRAEQVVWTGGFAPSV